jgi:hypothetical protein
LFSKLGFTPYTLVSAIFAEHLLSKYRIAVQESSKGLVLSISLKILIYILTCLFVITLCACGGGGTSSGNNSGGSVVNTSPTAGAGSNQTIEENNEVALLGSGTDPDGSIVSYSWSQTAGTAVTLTNADTANASFTAPDVSNVETLNFQLTVTDNAGASATASVDITVNPIIVLTPSTALYSMDDTFSSSQVIYIGSSSEFVDGENLSLSDSAGNVIEIVGQQDGSGIVVIPSTISNGTAVFTGTRGGFTNQLSINIENVVFQEDKTIYLTNYIDELSLKVSEISNAQGTEDSQQLISQLAILEDFKNDIASVPLQKIEDLAWLLFVNFDSFLDSNSVILEKSSQAVDHYTCRQLWARAVLAGVAADVAIGAGAVSIEPITKTLAVVVGAVALNVLVDNLKDVVSHNCIGSVSGTSIFVELEEEIEDLSHDVIIDTRTSKALINHSKHIATRAKSSILSFYDHDTVSLKVLVTSEPPAAMLLIIKQIQWLTNLVSSIVPNGILEEVDKLDDPVTVDLTSTATLQQVDLNSVSCTGDTRAYTCGFPSGESFYSNPVNFNFEVTHPELTTAIIQNARVLPRDTPLLEDQTFIVFAGSEDAIVNRLFIHVIEDITWLYYELTKVQGFEVTTQPAYGVIENAFIEPGIIDYAAKMTDGMPETTSFEVTTWNRYGSSSVATITLNLTIPPPLEAQDASFTIIQSQVLAETLLADDADSFAIVTGPVNGSITSFDPATGAFSYDPLDDHVGQDSFTFKAVDYRGDSNIASVFINVRSTDCVAGNQMDTGTGITWQQVCWENNLIRTEIPYVNDLKNGLQRDYFQSGSISRETPYVEGIIQGVLKVYNDGGKLYASHTVVDNQNHGLELIYYPNQILWHQSIYFNGTLSTKKLYTDKGILHSYIVLRGNKVYEESYDDAGILDTVIRYAGGVRVYYAAYNTEGAIIYECYCE